MPRKKRKSTSVRKDSPTKRRRLSDESPSLTPIDPRRSVSSSFVDGPASSLQHPLADGVLEERLGADISLKQEANGHIDLVAKGGTNGTSGRFGRGRLTSSDEISPTVKDEDGISRPKRQVAMKPIDYHALHNHIPTPTAKWLKYILDPECDIQEGESLALRRAEH